MLMIIPCRRDHHLQGIVIAVVVTIIVSIIIVTILVIIVVLAVITVVLLLITVVLALIIIVGVLKSFPVGNWQSVSCYQAILHQLPNQQTLFTPCNRILFACIC